MDDYAISALTAQNDRQDLRLDSHGREIQGLKNRESTMIERVAVLMTSVEGLRGDVRKAVVALVIMAITQIVLGRIG